MVGVAVCTIVSANYLARARVLMQSLASVHPDWQRHVLVVDAFEGRFDPEAEDFQVTQVGELPIEKPAGLVFRYTRLEANTALKPAYFRHLFDTTGCEAVLYLDPDIFVFERLEEVERAGASGSLMCLTPHVMEPITDTREPSQETLRRAGVFNLGFIALFRHPGLDGFLAWWWSKTEHSCRVDFEEGLFLDQRWLDMAPQRFQGVKVIEHRGYNVAYWNLAERPVSCGGEKAKSGYRAGTWPLVFYHFSGYRLERPDQLSEFQDRFRLDELGPLSGLFDDYRAAVEAAGEAECRDFHYAFGSFPDATPIPDEVRRLYARDASVEADAGDDPFALGPDYFNAADDGDAGARPRVTRLMRSIWESRSDLQQAFPKGLGSGRRDLAWWFVERVAPEHGLPEAFVAPVRSSLVEPAHLRLRLLARAQRVADRLRPLARHFHPRLVSWVKRALIRGPALR